MTAYKRIVERTPKVASSLRHTTQPEGHIGTGVPIEFCSTEAELPTHLLDCDTRSPAILYQL